MTVRSLPIGEVMEIAYEAHGTGRPLVLVHGADSARNQFADLVPRLGPGIRAVVYDQRDTGDSRNPAASYSMADLADDLAQLIHGLGDGPAFVLGTSFGGAVAMQAALRHPDAVAGLMLVATTASKSAVTAYLDRVGGLAQGERQAFALEGAVRPSFLEDPAALALLEAAITTRTPEQRARRMAALDTHDVEAELGRLQVPTLVVHGDADPVIPYSSGLTLAERIPGARLHPIAGGRHGLAFEFADELAALASSFVRGDGSAAGTP